MQLTYHQTMNVATHVTHVQAWHNAAAVSRRERHAVLATQQAQGQAPPLLALRKAFELWQEHITAEVQCRYLQHKYQQHLLYRIWQLWTQLPAARLQLQRIQSAFSAIGAQWLQRWGLLAFMQHGCECKAKRQLEYSRLCMTLHSWRSSTARTTRHCRLLAGRTLVRERWQLWQCFRPWLRLAATAARQRLAAVASKLQVTFLFACLSVCQDVFTFSQHSMVNLAMRPSFTSDTCLCRRCWKTSRQGCAVLSCRQQQSQRSFSCLSCTTRSCSSKRMLHVQVPWQVGQMHNQRTKDLIPRQEPLSVHNV